MHLTGWRMWALTPDGDLESPYHRDADRWIGTEQVTSCPRGHSAPEEGCTCGVFAFIEAAPAFDWAERQGLMRRMVTSDALVVGRVALSGRVIERASGTLGAVVRAERARPVAVYLPIDLRRRYGRALSERYQVSVLALERAAERPSALRRTWYALAGVLHGYWYLLFGEPLGAVFRRLRRLLPR